MVLWRNKMEDHFFSNTCFTPAQYYMHLLCLQTFSACLLKQRPHPTLTLFPFLPLHFPLPSPREFTGWSDMHRTLLWKMMNNSKHSLLEQSGLLWRRPGFGELIYSELSADSAGPWAHNGSPPHKAQGLPDGSFEGNPEKDNKEGHTHHFPNEMVVWPERFKWLCLDSFGY